MSDAGGGLLRSPDQKEAMVRLFYEHQRKANIYYAYHTIHRYIEEPFTSYMPEALFNIARFLTHELITLQVGWPTAGQSDK